MAKALSMNDDSSDIEAASTGVRHADELFNLFGKDAQKVLEATSEMAAIMGRHKLTPEQAEVAIRHLKEMCDAFNEYRNRVKAKKRN